MAKTITQKVVFKNTAAKKLYSIYMNAKEHSAATGALAKITNKQGTSFRAHGKYITGKNLQLMKDKMIVQSWRAADWKKSDIDSILILQFEQKGKDAIVQMVHVGVPEVHYEGLKKGWDLFYWNPWKAYLFSKGK